jgi:hypothetical membrane protein
MGKISGMLFFLAGFVILMGITTAEIFYPGYSISKNFISNLGSTRPPDIIIHQPSAAIFDVAMILAGILTTLGGFFLSVKKEKVLRAVIIVMGMASFGVGIFPAFYGLLHDLVAGVAFAAGGVAAIFSSKIITPPFKYLAIILGSIALVVLILGVFLPTSIVPTLGNGGVERWVAYPITIWLIGFGGYLLASTKFK